MIEQNKWNELAVLFCEEREKYSFNSVLLDDYITSLFPNILGKYVADIGAGIGVMSRRIAEKGAVVDAYEPDEDIRKLLEINTSSNNNINIIPRGIESIEGMTNAYDVILCLNVLDYVHDIKSALNHMYNALLDNGRIIISIPHPLKDRNGWYKEIVNEQPKYLFFVFDDYFREGECQKLREDRYGSVKITNHTSIHRTISTYLNSIIRTGFIIESIEEPKPGEAAAEDNPIIYEKCSRIPYFMVITARK